MLRKDLIDLDFFLELLSLKLSGSRDLDHDARMDLVDKGDGSFPDPVHIRKLLLDRHDEVEIQRWEEVLGRWFCKMRR